MSVSWMPRQEGRKPSDARKLPTPPIGSRDHEPSALPARMSPWLAPPRPALGAAWIRLGWVLLIVVDFARRAAASRIQVSTLVNWPRRSGSARRPGCPPRSGLTGLNPPD